MMWWRRTNREELPEESPIPPGLLPLEKAPDAIWRAIETQLDAPTRRPVNMWQWAVAAALIVGLTGAWFATRQPRTAWSQEIDLRPALESF